MSARDGVAVVLIAVFLTGCDGAHGGDAKPGGGGMPPALVTTSPVESATVPVTIDAIGRSVATELVSVQAQVSGALTAIHFKDGAELKKGDLLFTIDPRPYQAQLDLAEANLAQNEAQLELGKLEFERMTTLLRTNAISRQEYDSRKSNVAITEAMVKSSQASVAAAKLNVEFCTIRSPIDGRAGQRLVDLGNIVMLNASTPLLTIQRQDPIYVDFTVSERDLAAVRRGLADKTLRAEVRVPGEPGAPAIGAVTFIDNAVQDATGTIKLRAQLENGERRFWPGQFLAVRLVLRMREALVVPPNAIQIGQQGPFVYVVKADSTAELRPVVTGQRQGDKVVVESGVVAGEAIVVNGQLMLMPGAKVNVAKPAAAGPAMEGAPR